MESIEQDRKERSKPVRGTAATRDSRLNVSEFGSERLGYRLSNGLFSFC